MDPEAAGSVWWHGVWKSQGTSEFQFYCSQVSGIAKGAIFEVFLCDSQSPQNIRGKVVVVGFDEADNSDICVCESLPGPENDFDIPEDSSRVVARLVQWKALPIVFVDSSAINLFTQSELADAIILRNIWDSGVEITVSYDTMKTRVKIERHDPFFCWLDSNPEQRSDDSKKTISFEYTSAQSLAEGLRESAQFTHHLYRLPTPNRMSQIWNIEVQFRQFDLSQQPATAAEIFWLDNEDWTDHFAGQESIQSVDVGMPPNRRPITLRKARFSYKADAAYAIKLINKSPVDLHVSAYLFNPADYSILVCQPVSITVSTKAHHVLHNQPIYEGPESDNTAPPLRASGSKQSIETRREEKEYDKTSPLPLRLRLGHQQKRQMYFLKVFAAAKHTKLGGMKQEGFNKPDSTLLSRSTQIDSTFKAAGLISQDDAMRTMSQRQWNCWTYALEVERPQRLRTLEV
ncbi:hypothetical protein EVJ58_g5327 [Rhodofomes roseus]|uniref:Uncharacterized protein n=1 Tax=Rhodofomes roseus TaxID=34475 RepID=A0A4Y9YFD6_9APHY|nr:hypothetical protein EVJ58_g5327 [Rhodofomes roseus]